MFPSSVCSSLCTHTHEVARPRQNRDTPHADIRHCQRTNCLPSCDLSSTKTTQLSNLTSPHLTLPHHKHRPVALPAPSTSHHCSSQAQWANTPPQRTPTIQPSHTRHHTCTSAKAAATATVKRSRHTHLHHYQAQPSPAVLCWLQQPSPRHLQRCASPHRPKAPRKH